MEPSHKGKYRGFDHIRFWVGNAKQAATFYCIRFGFQRVAYRGLETDCRDVVSHVIRKDDITFVLDSPLNPDDETNRVMSLHLKTHGDGVKDVALRVTDCRFIYQKAIERGAKSIMPPTELKDEHGTVWIATISTYGDTVHTFVERTNYSGTFMPGYKHVEDTDALNKTLPDTSILYVDHVVGNQPDLQMESVCKQYEQQLEFKRFWSVDDKQIHTEYSALRSIVVTDADETVKMPINEPAQARRKSQIQEYVDYYGDAGVQHIALRTNDIISAISNMRARGVEFLKVPHAYYDLLFKKLETAKIKVTEDLEMIRKLRILIDYDDNGYLLQIFTKPVEDRPTLFLEIIQRHDHNVRMR